MKCMLLGHRNAPSDLYSKLKDEIIKLLDKGAEHFYVGNNGNFDYLAQMALADVDKERDDLKYSIVLSRLDEKAVGGAQEKTVFPEGQENALPRFAVAKRNVWLLENSNIIITYMVDKYSNSYKIIEKATRRGLTVINLAKKK